jgi:hypothetical protein
MSVVVALEWRFSPPDYFEKPITISRDDYTMTIADGKVEAKISSEVYDANPLMRQMLQNITSSRFLGVQSLTHRPYDLSATKMTRVHPDSHMDISIEPIRLVVPDVPTVRVYTRVVDKDGNIISDSMLDHSNELEHRIEKKNEFAERVANHATDDLLISLLQSYGAAVRDSSNEFLHLYEIRDALRERFGNIKTASLALGITSPQWKRFRELCNDSSLRQGRHRGMSIRAHRNATDSELTEARALAFGMIEAYLQYLESAASSP